MLTHSGTACISLRRRESLAQGGGFALIIALVMLGFLLLLVLSLGGLTNVSLQEGAMRGEQERARANALFGLLEGLGRLQESAGADQRVTARAALLDAGSANPWWTGVWRSDGATTHGDTAPLPLRWLVSGDEPDPDTELVDMQSVSLVSDRGSGAVRAGLVSIETGADSGRYGWWVGDEGVKAKFVTTDPYPALLDAAANNAERDSLRFARWRSSQGMSLNAVRNLGGALEAEDEVALRDGVADDNLPLLLQDSLTATAWKRHFHDFTAWSRGLLTDTRRGGLRYDLTQAFESDAVFNRDFLANDQRGRFGLLADIVDPRTGLLDEAGSLPTNAQMASANTWAYKGPNFGVLKDYYRLYDLLGASPLSALPSLEPRLADTAGYEGPWPSPYRSVDGTNVQDAFHTNNPLMVSLAYVQMGFGVSLYHAGTGPAGEAVYKIQLESKPVIAFYNPHNVTLRNVRLRFRWALNPRLTLRLWESAAGSPTAAQTITFRLHEFFPRADITNDDDGRSEGYIFLVAGGEEEDSFDFLPGETRYFSLADKQINYHAGISGSSFTPFDMEAEYDEQGRVFMRLDNVHVASQRGESTVANPRADTTGHFGLTTAEREALTVTVPAGYDAAQTAAYLQGRNVSLSLELLDPGRIWLLHARGTSYVETLDMLGNWLHVKPPVQSPPAFNLLDAMAAPTLVTFGYGLSGVSETEQAVRVLVDANVRPLVYNTEYEVFFGNQGLDSSTLMRGGMLSDPAPPLSGDRNQGSWVSTTGAQLPLFEVPAAPLQSLASFQHAYLSRYNHEPSYAFANSFASVRIPRTEYFKPAYAGRAAWVNYDISFVMNEALWDGYFFSTLPYNTLRKTGNTAFDAEIGKVTAGGSVLPNSRMQLGRFGEDLAERLRDFSGSEGGLSGYRPASVLEVDGALNVNSDSAEAWAALLKTLRDGHVPVRDPATGSLSWLSGQSNAFARSSVAAAGSADFWKGFRSLTDAQVESLASAIVAQNRKRGPYLSLASFVNRKLADSDEGLMGALQAAIQATDINATAATVSGANPVNMATTSTHLHDNSTGPQATGFPGFLTQADLLQVIGPALSARSDTFRIRAYGEVSDRNSGSATAKAWCEAIVTRVVEPVAGSGGFGETVNPTSPMGRRFHIIAFRWLNESEL